MEETRKKVFQYVATMINPLIKILQEYNVSHMELCDIAKECYVRQTRRNMNQTNSDVYQQVPKLTGIPPDECMAILKNEFRQSNIESSLVSNIVKGWLRDRDFVDENGAPYRLPLNEGVRSFNRLACRYGSDQPHDALIEEMLRLGTIEFQDKSVVCLKEHAYIPKNDNMESLRIVSTHVCDMIETIGFNLQNPSHRRFQRQLCYDVIPIEAIQSFEKISTEQANILLTNLNMWLADHANNTKPVNQTARVGMGVYYFCSPTSEDVADC